MSKSQKSKTIIRETLQPCRVGYHDGCPGRHVTKTKIVRCDCEHHTDVNYSLRRIHIPTSQGGAEAAR